MKIAASWSKPDGIPSLIGRKKVDWSIFENGTTIPQEFHSDFLEANGGIAVARGEGRNAFLYVDDAAYSARFTNVDRAVASDTLQIRYDSNSNLKTLLADRLHLTYAYLLSARERLGAGEGKKLYVDVPDSLAAYIDFVAMGVPFHYRLSLLPAQPRK